MPPPPPRFSVGGPNISPYHQQFPSHNQHAANHQPPLGGNLSHFNPNSFSTNGNMLSLASAAGLGAAGSVFASETGLGSNAARMGFAHAGALQHQQQQQQQHGQQQSHGMTGDHVSRNRDKGRIRDVWKHNLHEEMAILRDLVESYPYIAMDTEFPGVVARPMGGFRGKSDYHYQCLRTNVDLLKVIQIGISLFNEDGEIPATRQNATDSVDFAMGGRQNGVHTQLPHAWQFNFKFSLTDDMFNQTSIESLQAAGLDFNSMERDGIDPHEFASLLIPSGLVCFDNVKWISFHGGYDFGYLTKLLICRHLPCDEIEFDQIMKLYFPSTYDVKHLLKHAIKLMNSNQLTPLGPDQMEVLQRFEQKSGLENIAEAFKIKRVGAAHQAGSDSLVTGRVFFTLREKIYNGDISEEHVGKVWGLGVPDYSINAGSINLGSGGPVGGLNNAQLDSTPPGAAQNGNSAQQQNGGGPNTPNSASVTLANTPGPTAHNTNGGSIGPITPGGGGGVFGSFSFAGPTR